MWTNIGKITCDGPDCDASVADNRWAKTKADWFFAKDGGAWCPAHIPEWVAAWREKSIKEQLKG